MGGIHGAADLVKTLPGPCNRKGWWVWMCWNHRQVQQGLRRGELEHMHGTILPCKLKPCPMECLLARMRMISAEGGVWCCREPGGLPKIQPIELLVPRKTVMSTIAARLVTFRVLLSASGQVEQ
mmetsp:Transcript_7558/g.46484  ORF Transcript_7558/g.46484 Transcript_7558/m.46484 type:complete len:124 (-) Transcript_7558:2212-2583(-)